MEESSFKTYDEAAENKKAVDLLERLIYSITTVNLDMGGNHSYALSHRSNKIIREAMEFLYVKNET
jgi:hypothetical protein